MSHEINVLSMPIESFLFFFKGNQERANEQLGKIEGICCLKKYSLISEMEVLYNYKYLNCTISCCTNLIF